MSGYNSDVRKLRIYVTGTRASVPESEATGLEHFSSFCSYIIKSDQENVVSRGSRRLGSISTTKTAQYQGLIFGMRACAKLGDTHPTDLEFVSDFSTCVNHMKETCGDNPWKVFYHIAKGLEAHLKSLSWVRAITFSNAAKGDADIAAALELAKTKAGQEVDLDNFNLEALTYYPNLCSMSIFSVAKDGDDSWSSPFAGSNDIGAIVSDQAMYIDADYLATTHGVETFETLEDPGRLSWIDARCGSLEVLGVFKGTIKLKADLIAGFKIESVVNVNRFVVVHKLPVPLHAHVAADHSNRKMNYPWKGVAWRGSRGVFTSMIQKIGDDGVEKVPKFPLMANFRKIAKKYQQHPFWHVNPSVEFIPVGKKRIMRELPEAGILAMGAVIGQPDHYQSVEHDDY